MSSPPPASTLGDFDDNAMEEETATEGSCPHIEAAFGVEAAKLSMLRKYKSAVAWCVSNAGTPAKRRKVSCWTFQTVVLFLYLSVCKLQSPTCGTCGLVLPRPFICLHCSYGGCWKNNHILDHMKDLNHQFCESRLTYAVYVYPCSRCLRRRRQEWLGLLPGL